MNNIFHERVIEWRGQNVRLIYLPARFNGVCHLEFHSENRAPLPITETGYLSHFFFSDNAPSFEDVIQNAIAWLDDEAQSKRWKNHVEASKQGDLLDLL